MMPDRTRLAALFAFGLIVVGALRVAVVVDAAPMLGYANQFDMRRVSACVGFWPDVAPPAQLEAHPEAPIARFVRGETRPAECYVSTELAFVGVALALHAAAGAADGAIDLRQVGMVKAIALVALALALHGVFRRRPAWAVLHAAVFALVVCDPLDTLWLNTLYTEFGALFCAYASVALLVAIVARESLSAPPSTRLVIAFGASLFGLGLSRQQHLLLPSLLALPAVISMWRPARRSASGLVIVALGILVVQTTVVGRHPTIVAANNADVVLGVILPASQNQARTAERLGLPPRCLRSVGATWYLPMGERLEAACPEALSLPRWRLGALLATEPDTLFRATLRVLPQLQDWRLGYLGAVEGSAYAGAAAVRAEAGPLAASIAPAVTALPPKIFLGGLAASLALLFAGVAVALRAAARQRRAPLAWLQVALTATAWYAIATAIFGDGQVEAARHAHLAAACLAAAAVVLAGTLAASVLFPASTGLERADAAGYAAVALVAAALAQGPLQAALASVPMAVGAIDRPRSNVVPVAPVEFAGWALDPLGVGGVELETIGGKTYPATIGLSYAGSRGEPLALYYPTYPDREHGGFTALLPADALERGAIEVRTIVINVAGVRTEIDRRQLVAGAR